MWTPVLLSKPTNISIGASFFTVVALRFVPGAKLHQVADHRFVNVFVISVLAWRLLMLESDLYCGALALLVERDRGERCALPVLVALHNSLLPLWQLSQTAGDPDHVFVGPAHQLLALLLSHRRFQSVFAHVFLVLLAGYAC